MLLEAKHAENKRLREALESITQHWNGTHDKRIMLEVCRRNEEVARTALAGGAK